MTYSPFFIDLSNNDPIFDAAAYRKAGHVIVGLKATEGVSFIDPDHGRLAHAAGGEHIAVMHYHFARPDLNTDAEKEAAHFISVATSGNLDGPRDYLVLDLERATPAGWAPDPAWSARFDRYIRAHTRFRTILYSFRSALQAAPASHWFAGPPYREWDADFSSRPGRRVARCDDHRPPVHRRRVRPHAAWSVGRPGNIGRECSSRPVSEGCVRCRLASR